ncbi:MAG: transposase [Patescibacteria group bacterium]|nr:transposase [Patescibacteria group bacterium]
MQSRKDPLVNDQYYHIFSRSIAQFKIFNNNEDYLRMLDILDLYRYIDFIYKYSNFNELTDANQQAIIANLRKDNDVLVEIIAYCLMPTHLHLLLKQITDKGIAKYMSKLLNSYARYFNIKHKRVGPLWTGRFKSIVVSSDEQLLHLTRYIHLNPTSAGLVDKLNSWEFSSYYEYIDSDIKKEKICSFSDILTLSPKEYKKFVESRKSYQKELSLIKNVLIDNYTG